jgi:uncharacterized membrane protein
MARPFAPLLLWCFGLVALRIGMTGRLTYIFLAWNLILAAVPLIASRRLLRGNERGAPALLQAAWFAIWLLFLPNAPYIVTDLMHLRPRPGVPIWFDIAVVASAAGTGLLLGYGSVATVQGLVAKRWGVVKGWLFAAATLALSAFGIYLGRFLRWNSWDAVANPLGVLGDIGARIVNPLAYPRTLAVTAIYGVTLILGYLALQTAPRVTSLRE